MHLDDVEIIPPLGWDETFRWAVTSGHTPDELDRLARIYARGVERAALRAAALVMRGLR